MAMSRVFRSLFLGMFLTASAFASADEWMLPEAKDYHSPDGTYRFTVVPRALKDDYSYFHDKVRGIDRPGQDPDGATECTGTLFINGDGNTHRSLWTRPLLNDVAPVRALVSSGGRYVVTFDEWHRMGFGPNAVVIYGPGGRLVRRFALTDLMPEEAVARLPASVSSIWWGGRHAIDGGGDILVLKIVADGKIPLLEKPAYRDLRIDLATGRILEEAKP